MLTSFRLKHLLTSAILLFYTLGANAAESDKPPFFKLEYQRKTAWMLGSVHVGKADFYPMPKVIEKAFKQSKSIAVEADIANADVMSLIRKYGLNQTQLSAEQQASWQSYCAPRQAFCQSITGLAPWMQAMQITMTHFNAVGLSPEYGVDSHFLARRAGKTVYELESVEQQFAMLAGFSDEVQWLMLEEAIKEQPEDASELVQVWRDGDHKTLTEIMEGDMTKPEQKDFVEQLLWQRNRDMANTSLALLQNNSTQGPLFIIIGAGHLVGQHTIPGLLADKGVKVTQILPAP